MAEPTTWTTTTTHGDVGVLTYSTLNPAEIEASVRSAKAGAVVSFVGYTRDEFQGKKVTHLEYESYVPLALKTLNTILLEVRSLPPLPPTSHLCFDHTHHATLTSSTTSIDLTNITVHHLLGISPPLTPSLVICVASPHRKEAFVVCEWLLERVKERVQVWKREWYEDGTVFVGMDGEGVEGKGGRSNEEKSRWKENFPREV